MARDSRLDDRPLGWRSWRSWRSARPAPITELYVSLQEVVCRPCKGSGYLEVELPGSRVVVPFPVYVLARCMTCEGKGRCGVLVAHRVRRT